MKFDCKEISISDEKFGCTLTYDNDLFEISINPNDHEFENLKKALEKIINNKGQLIIHD